MLSNVKIQSEMGKGQLRNALVAVGSGTVRGVVWGGVVAHGGVVGGYASYRLSGRSGVMLLRDEGPRCSMTPPVTIAQE